jgi:hypothetical protein
VALFLIPGLLHAVMLPSMAAVQGRLQWQDWLTPQPDGLYHSPASRGWGTLTIQGLVRHILLNAFLGLAVFPSWHCSRKLVGEHGCFRDLSIAWAPDAQLWSLQSFGRFGMCRSSYRAFCTLMGCRR